MFSRTFLFSSHMPLWLAHLAAFFIVCIGSLALNVALHRFFIRGEKIVGEIVWEIKRKQPKNTVSKGQKTASKMRSMWKTVQYFLDLLDVMGDRWRRRKGGGRRRLTLFAVIFLSCGLLSLAPPPPPPVHLASDFSTFLFEIVSDLSRLKSHRRPSRLL